jgi:hypothetical protein
MRSRWSSVINDIKLLIEAIKKLIPELKRPKQRGRKPKRSLKSYLSLIVAKEAKKTSLREAEVGLSKLVCNERVPKSTISYWEKRFDSSLIERIVKAIGSKVEELLGYLFSILDSTKFTSWNKSLIEFHLLVRKAKETVYPVAIAFGSSFLTPLRAIVSGEGELFADAWYDNNLILKRMFKQGYLPIVKPTKGRVRKYYRRKARKIWNNPLIKLEQRYRRRGIGESIFGSLKNWLGDRLKTRLIASTITRIGARIIAYLARIYIRITSFIMNFWTRSIV